MLTEKQAWAVAKRLYYAHGLCTELRILHTKGLITDAMERHMRGQLEVFARRANTLRRTRVGSRAWLWIGAWFWSHDARGNRARRQFCQRQIDRIEREAAGRRAR